MYKQDKCSAPWLSTSQVNSCRARAILLFTSVTHMMFWRYCVVMFWFSPPLPRLLATRRLYLPPFSSSCTRSPDLVHSRFPSCSLHALHPRPPTNFLRILLPTCSPNSRRSRSLLFEGVGCVCNSDSGLRADTTYDLIYLAAVL